jgi:hypothetical protein
MLLLMLALVVGIQVSVGALRSERGLYSDEAAHLMNGLVIRDYVRDGFGQNPLIFARDYYQHYPKIAPLMWPPLFHVLLGGVLLPGWSPTIAALVLLGMFTTWIAWRLYFIVLTFASVPVAIGTVGLFLATPAVIRLTSSVMLDIAVAAFAMEAAYWLGRFSYSGRTRDAVWFGLMTAFACITKGNGLSAVVAALLLPLTGHSRALRRPGLYIAAAIVIILAAPPLAIAYQLDARLGDFGPLSWQLVGERLVFFSTHALRQLGGGPIALAIIGGVFAGAHRLARYSPTRGLATGMATMVAGAFVFHLLSPHRLSDPRYITLAYAPILGLTALGVVAVTRGIRSRPVRWSAQLGIFLGLWIALVARHPVLAAQAPLGYRDVMTFLLERNELAGRRVLIISNETGEGAGVVEAAVLHLTPRPTILRGSKILASDDWMGAHFSLRYQSAADALADLEAMHVDYVLLDRSAEARALRYWGQVEALTKDSSRVDLVLNTTVELTRGPLRPLSLYRLKVKSPGPAKRIELATPDISIGLK